MKNQDLERVSVLFRAVMVCVVVALVMGHVSAQVKSQASGFWNDSETWVGSVVPEDGDSVEIQNGHTVTVNDTLAEGGFALLQIRGTLRFANDVDITLKVNRIEIPVNGHFEVGTPTNRIGNKVIIELSNEHTVSGEALTIQVVGTLDIHGTVAKPWTRLATPANASSTSMTVQGTGLNWQLNDQLVIASTDFDMNQAQVVTVQSVTTSGGNSTVTFSPALSNSHYAGNPDGVDMRAEVALLSRSVVVRTEAESVNGLLGGHLIFQKSGSAPTVRLSYVEFTKLGQNKLVGRYPIHFHVNGSNAASYVDGCSIHGCFQRAIVIHETDGLKITNNVAYDIYGHAYFFENGPEKENELVGNLGLVTRRFDAPWAGFPPPVKDSDLVPATFWVTNTNNKLEGNVAAGSQGYGFEFVIVQDVGSSQTNVFKDNVAHSNEVNGFDSGKSRNFPTNGINPPVSVVALFENFIAYKNRQAGVWFRQYGQAEWLNTKLSDNRIGFYVASEGLVEDIQRWYSPYLKTPPYNFSLSGAPGDAVARVRNATVVGESDNVGNGPWSTHEDHWGRSLPVPGNPMLDLKGFEVYDGLVIVEDSMFKKFETKTGPPPEEECRHAGAFTPQRDRNADHGNPWAVDARNSACNISFDAISQQILFVPNAKVKLLASGEVVGKAGSDSTIIYDRDGSFVGSSAKTYIVTDTPLLRPTSGWPVPSSSQIVGALYVPAATVSGELGKYPYGSLRIEMINTGNPPNHLIVKPVNRSNVGQLTVYDSTFGENPNIPEVPFQQARFYQFNVLLSHWEEDSTYKQEEYQITYPNSSEQDLASFRVRLRFGIVGGHLVVDMPYLQDEPESVRIVDAPGTSSTALPQAADLATVRSAPPATGQQNAWFHDNNNSRLYIRLVLPAGGAGPFLYPLLSGREVIIDVEHNG